RANELSTVIKELASNKDLGVLDGNKVLEIKSGAVNKGKAVAKEIFNQNYEFIFSIGDDWTDEFMFEELPVSAYTVKVGLQKTAARFYVEDTDHVRQLLEEFAKC
ncbi:MAG: trehalose-phosphatase, partial [Leeuwenhoekiella sp.]